jgi:hypothetical protein
MSSNPSQPGSAKFFMPSILAQYRKGRTVKAAQVAQAAQGRYVAAFASESRSIKAAVAR